MLSCLAWYSQSRAKILLDPFPKIIGQRWLLISIYISSKLCSTFFIFIKLAYASTRYLKWASCLYWYIWSPACWRRSLRGRPWRWCGFRWGWPLSGGRWRCGRDGWQPKWLVGSSWTGNRSVQWSFDPSWNKLRSFWASQRLDQHFLAFAQPQGKSFWPKLGKLLVEDDWPKRFTEF